MVHAVTPQKKNNTEALHGNKTQENRSAHIKKEMAFYEDTKECPKVLRKLKFCVDCVPPSSVESEKCFTVVLRDCSYQGFGLH